MNCEKCQSPCEVIDKQERLMESFYVQHEQWTETLLNCKCPHCGHEFKEVI